MLQLGKETEVQALGKTWRLGRLEIRVIRELRDWIKEQVGDPFAHLEKYLDKLPADEQQRRVKEAAEVLDQLECFTLDSPLAKKWLKTELGAAKLAHLLLTVHQPAITEEEAFAVMQAIGAEKMSEALDDAGGKLPNAVAPAPLRKGRRGPSALPESTGPRSTAS